MQFKIIGFLENGDCEAITRKGEMIVVDPFVGCAWEYEDRESLLGLWFEVKNPHYFTEGINKILLPSENDFKILHSE